MSAPVLRLPIWRGDDADGEPPVRPRTRGDCVGGPRPCPFVSCTEHAIHGVLLSQGGDVLDDDAAAELVTTMTATCTLDVADRTVPVGGALRSVLVTPVDDAGDELDADDADGADEAGADKTCNDDAGTDPDAGTLQGIAKLWGLTRERIRQIEGKALRALTRRVAHLREVIEEEHASELRPARCGPVPASERRTWTDAPARYAHLPGPADVADGETEFWCGHMGTALRGSLCAKRHLARTQVHRGYASKTYPECARCDDGAGVAARVGTPVVTAPQRDPSPAVPARTIDWMGEGDGADDALDPADASLAAEQLDAPPAVPAPAPATTEALPTAAEEPEMVKLSKTARTVRRAEVAPRGGALATAPAPGAACLFPGCAQPHASYRETLDPALRLLCMPHRTRAQSLRTMRQISAAEAVAALMAGAGKHPGPRAARAAAPAPPPREADADVPRCEFGGCSEPCASVRATTPAGAEALCIVHRERALALARKRGLDVGGAIARLQVLARAGVGPTDGPDAINRALAAAGIETATKPTPTSPSMPKAAPAEDPPQGLLQVLRERDQALAQLRAAKNDVTTATSALCEAIAQTRNLEQQLREVRTTGDIEAEHLRQAEHRCENLRRDRDALALRLDAADVRIAELEGQQLADAVARPVEPRPLARLAALAAALIPDETIVWTVGATRDGSGQYRAAALGNDRTASWESVAATPDEALAGLLVLVEGMVRARLAALTAALETAR